MMRKSHWKKYQSISLAAPILFFLGAIAFFNVKTAEAQQEDWVKDEILLQLMELRKELKSVKSDLADLKNALERQVKREPIPKPQQVSLNSSIQFGDERASLAIVEFTDYQCPYCARHNQSVLPEIKEKLIKTGKARYVLYDFPLSFHAQAKTAAVAARCAGKQDRYWEMHTALFQNQRNLGEDFYGSKAKELGLDESAFGDCISDPSVTAKVEASIDYGNRIGVTGTPKFFVGKVREDVITDVIVISGAQSFGAFSRAIENLEKL